MFGISKVACAAEEQHLATSPCITAREIVIASTVRSVSNSTARCAVRELRSRGLPAQERADAYVVRKACLH
jgi:hypothetical protein